MSYRIARSALTALLLMTGALTSQRLSAQPATPGAATPAPQDRLAAAIEQGRARFHRAFLEHGLAGLSVAVAVDGEVVWADGFGWADVENRVAMWPDTKQRIGSVSKPLTAIALGLLVERGKVDLDAPVQRYVPSFPVKEHPITVRQVAGHLAGIRHYRGAEFLSDRRFDTVAESLSVFAGDPLLFEPGTRYSYSSYGWNLISAVIEGASGEPFLDFMEREVLRPLGLADTTADRNSELIERRTRFYDRDSGRLLNGPYVDNSLKWAGGGLLSTALDLIRFGDGLLRGKVLSRETLELLWKPLHTSDGATTGYGLGWEDFGAGPVPTGELPAWLGVDRARLREHKILGHGGGSIGGITAFVLLPDDGVVAAAISNTSGVPGLGRDLHLLAATMAVEVAEAAADRPRRASAAR